MSNGSGTGTPASAPGGSRAQVEQILVARDGPLMSAAGMIIAYTGINTDLNDPIAHGVRMLGGTVANPVLVTDADVDTVSLVYYDQLLDRCELRLLENLLGNLDDVSITAGPRKEELQQLALQVERKMKWLREKLVTVSEPGTFGLDFATHGS